MAMNRPAMYRDPKRLKRLLALSIAGGLAVLLFLFIGHRLSTVVRTDMLLSIAEHTDWTLNRIHQTAIQDGRIEWQLDAASARYSDNEQSAALENPSVTFFLNEGASVALSAQQGKLNTDSKDIKVFDRVVMVYSPYKLETEALQYHHAQRKISAKSPVSVTGRSVRIQADALVVDLDSESIRFDGHVVGTWSESN